jgi:hypothetical protein
MPESAYERARRHSNGQTVLNQDTGKYEHRDENWVAPEGKEACPSCGDYHHPENIKVERWVGPPDIVGAKPIARSENSAVYEDIVCPTCR